MSLDTLSASEQKYFDSKGATPPADAAPAAPAPTEPAPTEAPDPAAPARPAAEPKTVPLAALHEERERRKELQRQIEDVNRRADERFNLIAQKLAASAPSTDPTKREIPDPEKDAVGAIRMTAEEVKVLSDFKRQIETQAAQGQAIQALFAHASRLETDFEKDNPDFQAASAYLRDSRAQELTAFGVDAYRIQQQIGFEKLQLVQSALQHGRNPAEVIYALAKMRGYAPPRTGGKAAAADGEAAKLARIARGQEAGASLGAASGAAPGKTGIEALLAMSDAEFSTALDKMSADQLRQHFGN